MVKRILMVEDDGDARIIFRTILEHAGYQVMELTGGATTTAVVRRERPDLVLLDIGLPDIDGWEVATRLRNDPDVSAVPILVVTAEERSDGRLSVEDAALMQALHRMEERGLLAADWGITAKGRRARYYRLTRDGRVHLAAETERLTDYVDALTTVLTARTAGR